MDLERYMLPCLSKKIFGIDCPGCGAQRAFVMVAHGDFKAAFQMFPAIYTTIIFFIFLGLYMVDKSRNYTKIVIATAIVNSALMIVAYIYKLTNF